MTLFRTSREVRERYKISRSSLYRWQANPEIGFPKPIKIGHRTLWRESDLVALDEWIATDCRPVHEPNNRQSGT